MAFTGIKLPDNIREPRRETTIEKKCENIEQAVEFYVVELRRKFEKYQETDIVSDEGAIGMNNYITKRNGPYKKEEVKNDSRLKDKMMEEWARYFFGLEDETDEEFVEEKTREYRSIKESGNGAKLEKFLFVNLNRILAPDYFVMHASEYDDLSNGVDFVIVEADTGIVACGFDGVYANKGSEGYQNKVKKLRKQSERKGAALKYGFIFENNTIVKKELTNLPNFFLDMSEDDMKKLEHEMNYALGGEQKPSQSELEIFDGLVESLEEQARQYSRNDNINPRVKANLSVFEAVLEKVKANRRKFD